MKNDDLAPAIAGLGEKFPHYMHTFIPRSYTRLRGYPAIDRLFEILALRLMPHFTDVPIPIEHDLEGQRASMAANIYASCDAPLLCVGSPLVKAFAGADPFAHQDLLDGLTMPWPGFALVLPDDAPLESPNGPLRGMLIATSNSAVPVTALSAKPLTTKPIPGEIGYVFCVAWGNNYLIPARSIVVPYRGTLGSSLLAVPEQFGHIGEYVGDGKVELEAMSADDRAFYTQMTRVFINALLTFHHAPEYIEGDLESPLKVRDVHGKVQGRIYRPRWIGRTYASSSIVKPGESARKARFDAYLAGT